MHAHFNNLYFLYDPIVCSFVLIPDNGVFNAPTQPETSIP